ncbi:MAG: hypothetical protein FRX49_05557 [Trebouxia sp. A1-2]|nr:MAG: hypothetical protein FRX49_05557 [Trebouxia sp. A1-2]
MTDSAEFADVESIACAANVPTIVSTSYINDVRTSSCTSSLINKSQWSKFKAQKEVCYLRITHVNATYLNKVSLTLMGDDLRGVPLPLLGVFAALPMLRRASSPSGRLALCLPPVLRVKAAGFKTHMILGGLQKVPRGLSDGKGEQSSHCVAAPHHLHHHHSHASGRGTVHVTIQSRNLECLNTETLHEIQLEAVIACCHLNRSIAYGGCSSQQQRISSIKDGVGHI